MDWREIYARRLCTPEQAAALIAPGDRIFAGGAGSFPAVLIDAVRRPRGAARHPRS